MLIKIDLKKAFDRLEWFFFFKTLLFFNFPHKLSQLIMSYITTSETSILINGTRTHFFFPTRGIRQGDSMSSYIFILCMKRLSRNIKQVVQNKNWEPISLNRGGPQLSHLMFADDIILLAKAHKGNSEAILSTLNNFCSNSGQKVNTMKSLILFSKNCSDMGKNEIINHLNIKSTRDLSRYLGFPIISSRTITKDFRFILDNLHSKLAEWKMKFLNFARRTTLAKSTLNSIPTHIMQYIKLSSSITTKIDQIQRNFIWGSTVSKRKLHLVNWDDVCKSKTQGGLGLQQAQYKNVALLSKLAWRAHINSHNLWASLLLSKYGTEILN